MERLSKEVKCRTDVVGIFRNPAALLLRLAACVLIESHDEWQITERRYLSEASMAQLTPPGPTAITAASTTPEVIDATAIRTSWFTTPQASRGTSYTTSRDFMADTNRSGSGPFGGPHSQGLLPPLRSAGSVKDPCARFTRSRAARPASVLTWPPTPGSAELRATLRCRC